MRRDALPALLVLIMACEPGGSPKKVETKVETKVEAKTVVEAPPEDVEAPPKDAPVLAANGLQPGPMELGGGAIEVSLENGWERRKLSGGELGGLIAGGGADGDMDGEGFGGLGAAKGGAPAADARRAVGGAPGGTGSGYGSGGAAKKAKAEAAPAPAPMKPGKTGALEVLKDAGESAGPLRAGSTDDNADFEGFLKFLAKWTGRSDVAGKYQPLDVAGRQFIRVVDGDGLPIPAAQVSVTDAQTKRELWRARTYGDGRAPFYPKLWGAQVQASGSYSVSVSAAGETLSATWDGRSELSLKTSMPNKPGPLALEVLFLIDTTGSMGDEIDRIKSTLLAVNGKVKAVREDLELRYGAVLYKDIHDDYVTMAYPFTSDVAAFNQAMQTVTAGGGGDLPESLNQGLERAIVGMPWQADAAKLVFVVCDAPPQMRIKGDVLYGDSAVQAVGRGIKIHSVAASGLDELGTLVLRQLAQLTRGKFIFIEYGSTQESAAKHGVTGPVQSNNLDDIIAREITAEIEGWGRG